MYDRYPTSAWLSLALLAPPLIAGCLAPPERRAPGSLSIAAPSSGSLVTGLVLVSVSGADDAATYAVEYAGDGERWQSVPGAVDDPTSASFAWDTGELAAGDYRLRATAVSPDGRVERSPTVPVRVGKKPVALASALLDVESGRVRLDAAESYDPDGEVVEWVWGLPGSPPSSARIASLAIAEISAAAQVHLTVRDDSGLVDHSYYAIRLDPAAPALLLRRVVDCTCGSATLRGDAAGERTALGPDAAPEGEQWPDRVARSGPLDSRLLGDLWNNPRNPGIAQGQKRWAGFAFEALFTTTGPPDACDEGQLIRSTKVTSYANPNVGRRRCSQEGGAWDAPNQQCTSHSRWRGTAADRDQDGTEEVDVSTAAACAASGGVWEADANECVLEYAFDSDSWAWDQAHGYREAFEYKAHVESQQDPQKIVWADAPRCLSHGPAGLAIRCDRYQFRILSYVRGTDDRYCYTAFSGSVRFTAPGQRPAVDVTDVEERSGQDSLPGVPVIH